MTSARSFAYPEPMSTGSNTPPGVPPDGARHPAALPNAGTPTPFDEAQQLQQEELQRREQLLDMLIEDARAGRVKDPEGRNVKGRRDRKTPGGKLGRSGAADDKGASATRAEPTSNEPPSDTAGAAIDQAESAVKDLRRAISEADEPEGEKLVRLHRLV